MSASIQQTVDSLWNHQGIIQELLEKRLSKMNVYIHDEMRPFLDFVLLFL